MWGELRSCERRGLGKQWCCLGKELWLGQAVWGLGEARTFIHP